jgi:hypothetical protein
LRSDRGFAAGGHHLLETRLGPLDVLATIGANRAYEDLERHSARYALEDSPSPGMPRGARLPAPVLGHRTWWLLATRPGPSLRPESGIRGSGSSLPAVKQAADHEPAEPAQNQDRHIRLGDDGRRQAEKKAEEKADRPA